MSYFSLSGGRTTLVDLRGRTGVSGEVGCTPAGELGLETGLLGGVINDGESGELGASGAPRPQLRNDCDKKRRLAEFEE